MDARQVYCRLLASCETVRVREDGRLAISPAGSLSDELRSLVVAHRDELIAIVLREDERARSKAAKRSAMTGAAPAWPMSTVVALQCLEERGVRLAVVDDGQTIRVVSGRAALRPSDRAWIRDNKDALLELLPGREQWRRIEETL